MGEVWTLISSFVLIAVHLVCSETLQLPSFKYMKDNYEGFRHYGGQLSNKQLINQIGCNKTGLLHDTSALRLSYMFNRIGGNDTLGRQMIRLSKYGRDSVEGRDGLQYIFHPIAYGPYLADKYGYPSVSKLHDVDPVSMKRAFWGKQGILRIITYMKEGNKPVGHVALWDCDHLHQTKDWISRHSLITAEFWITQDSSCPDNEKKETEMEMPYNVPITELLKQRKWRRKFLKKYYQPAGHNARHHKHHHHDNSQQED